jgi:hypothetical protein
MSECEQEASMFGGDITVAQNALSPEITFFSHSLCLHHLQQCLSNRVPRNIRVHRTSSGVPRETGSYIYIYIYIYI